ncbi:hypothetical protein CO057_01245 [Candidatus Uhrbacteria bacterium CG_4_9_14_0_2_um_filter_41_50]|uniref:Uncharacterized protein n=1 Tax=Candidatus Uhrbacteria bacterium CG_4_9_14_0_2_um_filter_41_50 TaxID=1975031 RepID=A0A2M8EPS5_9BACT|nr:MAG: hypothetical protein COZ45_03905 [Candidatus Uhrbacteria bacterium CG_4_10_14_3_um_filter_41_21]PIZ55295.1 MAG: hypothetical protein COY24_00845 [Candidatus Uhrbacteria bacterium CG_4_10_14_0_2_um_filter_41_21]PJB84534.1 MAG: hypothetical protein CO086_03015 [Candidatus Uhrbacteria bacterium CG_4_9_14_0_8_um_filter_41_16]PJC24724.1 MAG: hypothetical protein CO057_01245 [Candidatus Uhrbacteria bacterium CG_4_9_14_0_2_um_filter_41_50]PJE74899.1 MAG: hypothetical protein COV03_02905 [Candi
MQNKQVTNNEIISRINETDTNLRNSIIKTNNSLNDLIDFLKEHMATKEDLRVMESKFDTKLGKLNHGLRDYIDRRIYDLRGDLVQIGVLKTN